MDVQGHGNTRNDVRWHIGTGYVYVFSAGTRMRRLNVERVPVLFSDETVSSVAADGIEDAGSGSFRMGGRDSPTTPCVTKTPLRR